MNSSASNCLLIWQVGCMDSSASNYRSMANADDGSAAAICRFTGCLDSAAINYNPSANLPAHCVGPISGCMDVRAANFYVDANVDDPSICVYTGCVRAQLSIRAFLNSSRRSSINPGSAP